MVFDAVTANGAANGNGEIFPGRGAGEPADPAAAACALPVGARPSAGRAAALRWRAASRPRDGAPPFPAGPRRVTVPAVHRPNDPAGTRSPHGSTTQLPRAAHPRAPLP